MSLTTGQRIIKFIEKYCIVPEGDFVGKPIKLEKFQKDFIIAVYDNPHITDTAILSIARKNAKTGTIAMIVLAHLVGPVAVQNSRITSGALSREQAAEVFNLASKMVQMSEKLSQLIRIVPSGKKLIGLTMNTEYQAISADSKTAHGKSPLVAILDEVGQIVGPRSDFVSAIETAQGAYKHPLIFYISTQAQNDSDMFSILIDDYRRNKPKKTICHVYEAKAGCDLMDKKEWKNANPALGSFRSYDDLKKQAEKASRIPSFVNTFRNLNLNQRVSVNSPFISMDDWKKCAGELPPLEDCEKIYGALDLSGKIDLTAMVLLGILDGKNYLYPYFWTPEKGLRERADRDRAPYDIWVDQGLISTTPRATVDYEFVATESAEILSPLENFEEMAFDRWRIEFLQKEFERISFEISMKPFGQGFKDMAPAVEKFEDMVLNGEIIHGDHPVMNMCMANARVIKNPAGDRKLDKMKVFGRIDGAVAGVMAVGQFNKVDDPDDIDDFINNPLVLG